MRTSIMSRTGFCDGWLLLIYKPLKYPEICAYFNIVGYLDIGVHPDIGVYPDIQVHTDILVVPRIGVHQRCISRYTAGFYSGKRGNCLLRLAVGRAAGRMSALSPIGIRPKNPARHADFRPGSITKQQWEISLVPQGYGGEVWCICGRSLACVMGSTQSNQWVASFGPPAAELPCGFDFAAVALLSNLTYCTD